MYCLDLLHVFQWILVAAARMLSDLDARLSVGTCGCSTDASRPIQSPTLHTLLTRALSTWKISWTDFTSRKLRADDLEVSCTRAEHGGTPHAEPTTLNYTSLADQDQRLEIMPPNAAHTEVSYRMCGREPT